MCVDRRNLKGSRHGTTALGQGSSAPATGVVWPADGSRRAAPVCTNGSRRRESPAGAREPSAPEADPVRRLPPSHHSETKRVDSPVDCPRVGPGSNSVCRQGTMSSSGPQREVGPRVRPGTHGSKSTPLLYQCFPASRSARIPAYPLRDRARGPVGLRAQTFAIALRPTRLSAFLRPK